jgi:hypothetical protein
VNDNPMITEGQALARSYADRVHGPRIGQIARAWRHVSSAVTDIAVFELNFEVDSTAGSAD